VGNCDDLRNIEDVVDGAPEPGCEHEDITDWHLDEQGHNCNSCGADVPCIEVDGEKCERGEYQRQVASLLAERDELREALREFAYPPAAYGLGSIEAREMRIAKARALLSRHPVQPGKETPLAQDRDRILEDAAKLCESITASEICRWGSWDTEPVSPVEATRYAALRIRTLQSWNDQYRTRTPETP
jgi:hypothetical protein